VEHFIVHILHKSLEDTVVLEESEMYPFDSFPYSFRNQRLHRLQDHFLHQEITLVELFTKYLDISHVPTRRTLQVLAHFTSSLLHREKLLQLCEKNVVRTFDKKKYMVIFFLLGRKTIVL
jgi:sulfite reductase alpha subunit-like flavoprotein